MMPTDQASAYTPIVEVEVLTDDVDSSRAALCDCGLKFAASRGIDVDQAAVDHAITTGHPVTITTEYHRKTVRRAVKTQ